MGLMNNTLLKALFEEFAEAVIIKGLSVVPRT